MPERAEVVVVGGGSSGAVVAARLAGSGVKVLLLEAGVIPNDSPPPGSRVVTS